MYSQRLGVWMPCEESDNVQHVMNLVTCDQSDAALQQIYKDLNWQHFQRHNFTTVYLQSWAVEKVANFTFAQVMLETWFCIQVINLAICHNIVTNKKF